jgi:hypothetical protein
VEEHADGQGQEAPAGHPPAPAHAGREELHQCGGGHDGDEDGDGGGQGVGIGGVAGGYGVDGVGQEGAGYHQAVVDGRVPEDVPHDGQRQAGVPQDHVTP